MSGLMKDSWRLLTDDALPGILTMSELGSGHCHMPGKWALAEVLAGAATRMLVSDKQVPSLQESVSKAGIKSILKPAAAGTEACANSRHKKCRVRIQED